MSPLLLFLLILALAFGVMVWMFKPSKSEADVQRLLASISEMHTADTSGVNILKQEPLSAIPWLNDILLKVPGSQRLSLLIRQAGSNWTVGSVLIGSLLAALLTGWLLQLFTQGLLLAAGCGLAAGTLPLAYLHIKKKARFTRFEIVFPEAIDLMARALRSGHSITAAMEMVALETAQPVASEFRILFEEQNLGLPIREAILNLTRRVPLADVRFLAAAILIQKETGGNLVEVLDKTSTVMRERARLKGQFRIYTAQGRLTGWILCMLPFVIFGVLNIANHDYAKLLWTDPLGRQLIYGGLILMGIGIFVIRKILDFRA